MNYILNAAILLVFAWVSYRLGFNKGFLDGYEKGANVVLDQWKEWLDNIEEED